jgi:oligopeptide/dipeptide ABC transporter ATP-binding protein
LAENLLTVKDLEVHFPYKEHYFSFKKKFVYAVDGVSFSLDKGETLGVVGESGCGKTTLGMAIINLLAPTAGSIFYKNTDITNIYKYPLKERMDIQRKIQIIFQDPYSSLNPKMTLNRIIGDPLKVHGVPPKEREERIADVLNRVDLLPEHGHRFPHQFSGGQRQRIGIARALALQPNIIIGDEPVSALDVSIQAQVINLLIRLQKDFNLSYIFIAHDLAVIEHISDRIAVMYLGKIVELADARNIYQNPLHPYTRALLSAIPIPDPHKKTQRVILEGDVPSPQNPPSGCSFHPRCPSRFSGCDDISPTLQEKDKEHFVACHLYE